MQRFRSYLMEKLADSSVLVPQFNGGGIRIHKHWMWPSCCSVQKKYVDLDIFPKFQLPW